RFSARSAPRHWTAFRHRRVHDDFLPYKTLLKHQIFAFTFCIVRRLCEVKELFEKFFQNAFNSSARRADITIIIAHFEKKCHRCKEKTACRPFAVMLY